jgi:O-antigen/teichoic acid export membrane protein
MLSGQIAANLCFIATTLILAREFGSEDYGRYALITTTVMIIFLVVDVRVWEAATRFASEHLASDQPMEARAVLELGVLVNVLAGLVTTGAVAVLAGAVADSLLRDPGLTGSVVVYAAAAPFIALQQASAVIFRVFDRFGQLAVLIAVSPALRLAGSAAVVLADGGVSAVIVALVVADAVAAFVVVYAAHRRLVHSLPATMGFKARLARVRPDLAAMGRFLAISSLQGNLRLISTQLDVVLVGYLGSPAAAGTLKLARSFVVPLTVLQDPFLHAIYPRLSRARTLGQLGEAWLLVRRMTWLAAATLLPAAAVLCAASPWLIPALVGESFGSAYEVVIPLAAGTAVWGALFWVYPAALATDLQVRSLWALAVSSALQVGLIFLLFPVVGVVAAGIAYALFVALWMMLLTPAVARRMVALARTGVAVETPEHSVLRPR